MAVVHSLSTKLENYLNLRVLGRGRIPAYMHSGLLLVKCFFKQKNLFDTVLICAEYGLHCLIQEAESKVQIVHVVVNRDLLIDRIGRLLDGGDYPTVL